MRKILLTGFEPLGKHKINPSWEVAKRLSGEEGLEIVQIPVLYEKAGATVIERMTAGQAESVVMLSWGSRISGISLEKLAVNVADSELADNSATTLKGMEIVEGAPAAYFTNMPLEALAERLTQARISHQVSYHADTFVPNYAFFQTLHYMHAHDYLAQIGLFQLPWPPKFVGPNDPSMPWETMVRGIKTILDFLKSY